MGQGYPRTKRRRYPAGWCQECGKPLRIEPCLNCQQRDSDKRL